MPVDYTLASRKFEKQTRDGFLVVTAKCVHLKGNAKPYFSLTGELWSSARTYQSQNESYWLEGGCIHDQIIKAFPELRMIQKLHLADNDGVPMHAFENGWYWYSDYDGKGASQYDSEHTPRERAAKYLNIPTEELPLDLDKEEFREFVETLKPGWAIEAKKALDFLQYGGSDA